jgi:hypothetical protein
VSTIVISSRARGDRIQQLQPDPRVEPHRRLVEERSSRNDTRGRDTSARAISSRRR